jgi:hypothetical protein
MVAEHQLISVCVSECRHRKFNARAGNDQPMKKGDTALRANEKQLSTCSMCGYYGLEHVEIVWCSFVMFVRDGQCLLRARHSLYALRDVAARLAQKCILRLSDCWNPKVDTHL